LKKARRAHNRHQEDEGASHQIPSALPQTRGYGRDIRAAHKQTPFWQETRYADIFWATIRKPGDTVNAIERRELF
jgi:hypothetical protein